MALTSMTLNDLWPTFQGHDNIQRPITRLIVSRLWFVQWFRFQWPLVTLNVDLKVTEIPSTNCVRSWRAICLRLLSYCIFLCKQVVGLCCKLPCPVWCHWQYRSLTTVVDWTPPVWSRRAATSLSTRERGDWPAPPARSPGVETSTAAGRSLPSAVAASPSSRPVSVRISTEPTSSATLQRVQTTVCGVRRASNWWSWMGRWLRLTSVWGTLTRTHHSGSLMTRRQPRGPSTSRREASWKYVWLSKKTKSRWLSTVTNGDLATSSMFYIISVREWHRIIGCVYRIFT